MAKSKVKLLSLCLIIIAALSAFPAAAGAAAADGTAEGYLTYPPAADPAPVKSTAGLAWQFVQFILLFALVIGLVLLVTRFLAQRYYRLGSGKAMRILDSVYLGPNRAVYALEISNTVLILGVTERQINLLTELSDGEQVEYFRSRLPSDPPAAPEWSGWLGKFLAGKKTATRSGGEFNSYFEQQLNRLQRLKGEENGGRPFVRRDGRSGAERDDNDEWSR